MIPRTWPSLYLAIAISFGVAGLGGALTDLGPWYQQLAKPDWKPPDAAFGVIWSTIFTLCAFSAWWAWHASSHARQRRHMLALFTANAALNVLWSLIYFQWHRLDWAFNWDTWRLNPQAHAWQPQSAPSSVDSPSAPSPTLPVPAMPGTPDTPPVPSAAPR